LGKINISSVYFLMGNVLSEIQRVPSASVRNWLEKKAGSTFTPVHAKAEKLRNEMKKELDGLLQSSKMLYENSAKEIEKRNMKTYRRGRALNKLARLFIERIQLVKSPEEVSYDTLQEFIQKTQDALLATDVDTRNWFPRISPFFIIDRRRFLLSLERAKEELKEVNGFMTKEYVKTKTLEETFLSTEKLHVLEQNQKDLALEKAGIGNEEAFLNKTIMETQQKVSDLKSKGDLRQLSQTSEEIDALNTEVRRALQHLQKPFVKLQSLSLHGGGSGLTHEEVEKLSEYLTDPFKSLAREEPGYPLLKEILLKLEKAVKEDKLKLKPEKVRKAEQTIDSILNKLSIDDLHRKCKDAMVRKRGLQESSEVAETEKELSKLRERIEEQERKKRVLESDRITIEQSIAKVTEDIERLKNEMEKNIFSFTNERVTIQ
jgi:hypothetical protein